MFRINVFAVLLLICFSSFSQFSLKGKVKDSHDLNPLPGANIVIEGTFQGTHTNSGGNFGFGNLNSSTYKIRVSYLGYLSAEVEVELNKDTFIEVGLQRTPTLTSEVIVSATRADSRTPSTHTNVSKEEITSGNLGQDIPFLLSLTPGLVATSDAGNGVGYSWMNIRGSDNTRINVTVNGVPVNDSESHGVWWVNMPDLASSASSLQIQRGVGTSTQGAAAFGATISVNTATINDQTYAEIFSSGGSYNTLRNTVSFGTGLINQKWAFDGRLSRITSDGFIDRAESDLKSYYISGGYYGNKTVLKAITFSGSEKTYQAWNGVPSGFLQSNRTYNPSGRYVDENGNTTYYDNETDNYQQDHYQLHLTHEFSSAWVAAVAFHYTYGRGYYEQYRVNQRFSSYGLPDVTINDSTISRTDLIRRRWLDNHFYGGTWSLNYNSFGRLSATFGGGYNIYDGDHFGEIIWARFALNSDIRHRYYDNNAQKTDFNTFAKINYELLDGLHLFADMQYRFISYDFLGLGWLNNAVMPMDQNVVFNFWNPKTGVVLDINQNHNMYAFAGIANREPVRKDFTESGSDSRPEHETMYNIEIGYRYSSSRFRANANYYLMDYNNQLVLTGEINDVGGYTRTNIKDSYRTGIEMEAAFKVLPNLEWGGNLSFSRNKIPVFTEFSDVYDNEWNWTGIDERVYKNTDIAFSPSVVGASMISYEPLVGLKLGLISKYVGRQFIDNTMSSDRMLDAYLVNDLRFSYSMKDLIFKELEFTLQINNIHNEQYISNAWIYKGVVGDMGMIAIEDGYFPQAGRHFLAGLRLKF